MAPALAGCSAPPAAPPPGPTTAPSPGSNPTVKFGTDLGDFYIEVFEEMVPATAANFLGYARSHFYEGQRVHRVVADSIVQLGDPTTRDPTKPREAWGVGDPGLPAIPDEFNPQLRHDAAGVVSMAIAGPDTGTSQFFIALAPQRTLDDKHAVFGKVVAGLEVVQAIGRTPTTTAGRTQDVPVADIVVRSTQVVEAQRPASAVRHGLSAVSFYDRYNSTAGHILQFVAVVQNTGNVRENVSAGVDAPANWTYNVPCPRVRTGEDCPFGPVVGAGATKAFFFQLRTPPEATEIQDVPVRLWFAASDQNISLPLTIHVGTLGRVPQDGDRVTVDYAGAFPDGRLFDSSVRRIALNDSYPKSAFWRRDRNAPFLPLDFTPGEPGLIEGFSVSTRFLREGEIGATLLRPEQAYGAAGPGNQAPLAGKWLVFSIELQSVEPGG